MKTQPPHPARSREAGIVTVVFIALLAIMMILVMAETRSLIQLRQETKLLERQQLKRLNTLPPSSPVTP